MKSQTSKALRAARFSLLACTILAFEITGKAANLYWDTNGVSTGSGIATGTWGTSTFWNADSAGEANTFQSTTTSADNVFFSAGTNGTDGTVTVSGEQFVNNLTFEEGLINVSGGTLTFTDGAVINNLMPSPNIPRFSSALKTTGTVTLTGLRVWMKNSSFAGGGTLNINTSNGTLFEDGGALNGLSVINLNSGGIDIRGSINGHNYAAGTSLFINNSLTLNTNSLSAGTAVKWLGDIIINNGKTLTLSPQTTNTTLEVTGNISQQNGTGTLTINGAANTAVILSGKSSFTGMTTVASSAVLRLNHTDALRESPLQINTTGSLQFGNGIGTFNVGGLSGTGDIALTDTASAAVNLQIRGNSTYTGTFSGAGGITLNAPSAAQTFGKSQTYSGATTLNAGTLTLAFTDPEAPASNLVSSSSALVLGGGKLQVNQPDADTLVRVQTFNGTTINAGSSAVTNRRGGARDLTVALGALTRNTGGTVNFSAIGGGATIGILSTTTNNTSGILGGYATFFESNGSGTNSNGTTWATMNSGKIIGLAEGSYTNTATTTNTTHLNLSANVLLNAGVTTGSVRFNNAITSPTLTLNGANTIASGGILVSSNVGANASLITGGTSLTSGNGQDLVVHQNNTSAALTIASKITGNIGLTKSGDGQLILSATNDYTGQTYLNGGTTTISSNSQLGDATTGAQINLNGGTLSASATVTLDNAGANKRNITLGANGGTLDAATGTVLTVSGNITGDGFLNKGPSAGRVVLTGTNTYRGATNVTSGNLQVGELGVGQTGTGSVNINGSTAVLSGTGTVGGATNVTQGVVRVGDVGGAGIGTLTFSDTSRNSLTLKGSLSPQTRLEMQLGLAGDVAFNDAANILANAGDLSSYFNLTSTLSAYEAEAGVHDRIDIAGTLNLDAGGKIAVSSLGYAPVMGDVFNLLDWGSINLNADGTGSSFSTATDLDLSAITLGAGLTWNLSLFTSHGIIVVVPEPGRATLFVFGITFLCLRRRRKA